MGTRPCYSLEQVTDVGESRNATDSQVSGGVGGGSNGDRGRRTQKSSRGSSTEAEREAELKAQGLREDLAKELAEVGRVVRWSFVSRFSCDLLLTAVYLVLVFGQWFLIVSC